MRIAFLNSAILAGFLLHTAAVAEDATPEPANGQGPPAADRQTIADPTILLIRDDAVRAELGLSENQSRAIDDLLKKHNRTLLAIRDVSPSGSDETVRPALADLRQQFAKNLSEEQRTRLTNLTLQVQGYSALLRNDISGKLKLTDVQRRRLSNVLEQSRTEAQEVRKSDAGSPPDKLQQKLAELQREQQKRVLGILDQRQVAQYAALLGAPFDLAKVTPSPADAPEFDDTNVWLNSEPVTMESLRGKVVVVHFFAFGCINCIHNYPWYKDWHERLSNKGVVLIGIHTPETANETKSELLEASLESYGLKFPVAVDNEKKMWQAWHNSIWPSVYIIDKHSRLRFWWYGELNWQEAGNQKVAQKQIEQLLAEE